MNPTAIEINTYAARVAYYCGCRRVDFSEDAWLLIEDAYANDMPVESAAYMLATEVLPTPEVEECNE